MSEDAQREMTLDEWVAKLPNIHKAARELKDLQDMAIRQKTVVSAARMYVGACKISHPDAADAYHHLESAVADHDAVRTPNAPQKT